MSARIKETKDKVLFWLREEGISPEEANDPNAYFNIGLRLGDWGATIFQNLRMIDSISVGSRWILGDEQLKLHKEMLDDPKRLAYYWDLQFMALSNPQIGEFEITPNPPNDFRALLITSNRIFYDSLTKQSLMDSIVGVHKTMVHAIFLLEKYGGVIPPYPPK
ncbi:MAG: DUF2299 family protein [Nitrososphaera sp.]